LIQSKVSFGKEQSWFSVMEIRLPLRIVSRKKTVYRGQKDKFKEQELKDRIVASWEEIYLDEIRKSISGWKKRLRWWWKRMEGTCIHEIYNHGTM
jgi:hypothetical protein